MSPRSRSLWVVVGSGGVGKTTLAAGLGLASARSGRDTLVMTFDPSHRLKDALGVGETARDREIRVASKTRGRLDASLLDVQATFDRVVKRYAPDKASAKRILDNRFYANLSGSLAGILEYMAVERLFEVAEQGRYDRIVLDTPPTRQALDFLGAPARITGFLESGALEIAMKPWFDASGRLRAGARLGPLGRGLESLLDRIVGLDLLRDMSEFFRAFGPLYDGFKERAREVEDLLRASGTTFVLVAGPGRDRIPDTLLFGRKLVESGHRLGPVVVNRLHPPPPSGWRPPRSRPEDGRDLVAWLGRRDGAALEELRGLMTADRPVVGVPLTPDEPTDLPALEALGREVLSRCGGIEP